jgi:hypothetical protein
MFAARLPVLDQIASGSVTVPLSERCEKCGNEPTDADGARRARAIERAVRPGEQVRAMEALARVGMSGNISVDDLRTRLIAQVREMREWGEENALAPTAIEALLNRLDGVWRS